MQACRVAERAVRNALLGLQCAGREDMARNGGEEIFTGIGVCGGFRAVRPDG